MHVGLVVRHPWLCLLAPGTIESHKILDALRVRSGMSERMYQDFGSFWTFYVSQHMRASNRALHWVGTTLGFVALAFVFVQLATFPMNLLWIPAGFAMGYAFAWIGHFGIEKNRPATFIYPLWSLFGDWKMWALMTTRRMGREVARVQALLDDGWTETPSGLVAPAAQAA